MVNVAVGLKRSVPPVKVTSGVIIHSLKGLPAYEEYALTVTVSPAGWEPPPEASMTVTFQVGGGGVGAVFTVTVATLDVTGVAPGALTVQ
jgi:hypothetical protein